MHNYVSNKKSWKMHLFKNKDHIYVVMTIGVALEEVLCSDVYPALFDLSLRKKMLVKLNSSIVSL